MTAPYQPFTGDLVRWRDTEWVGVVGEPRSGVLEGWWLVQWNEPEAFIGVHDGADLVPQKADSAVQS